MKPLRNVDVYRDNPSQPIASSQLPTPSPTPEPESSEAQQTAVHSNGVQEAPAQLAQDRDLTYPVATHGDGVALFDGAVEAKLVLSQGHTRDGKRRRSIGNLGFPTTEKVLKLSPAKIEELTSSPTSLPLRTASPIQEDISPIPTSPVDGIQARSPKACGDRAKTVGGSIGRPEVDGIGVKDSAAVVKNEEGVAEIFAAGSPLAAPRPVRPNLSERAASMPVVARRRRPSIKVQGGAPDGREHEASRTLPTLSLKALKEGVCNDSADTKRPPMPEPASSPMPTTLPIPPLSIATYLQLELSSDGPSALYIHRSVTADIPYEASKIKFERLLN